VASAADPSPPAPPRTNPLTKRQLIRALERLAFLAEVAEDRRARGLLRAARALEDEATAPDVLAAEGRLTEVEGIGPKFAELVEALLEGQPAELAEAIRKKVPETIADLARVKGLGAKKIRRLWRELGVNTVGELEHACRENRLVTLDGFGPATQAKVLAGIEALREHEGRLRRDEVQGLVASVLGALDGAHPAYVLGDFRRGHELVDAPVRIAIAEPMPEAVRQAAEATPEVALDPVPRDRLGWHALSQTADPAHLALLAERAVARGVELSTLTADTEEAVYRALALLPTPPERREPGVPLVGEAAARPRLVRLGDLRGAIHNHTIASDGSHTLAEMRAAATERRLDYLAITEHSESAFYARGLDAARLAEQAREIASLNEDGSGAATLLRGVESDILEDGSLDYPDEVLAELDVVVASVHRRYAQDRTAATARMVAAARHPFTAVVGHPTGRLLRGRPPNDFDVDALLDACAESGCAVELNGNPQRLDLSAEHLGRARERGVLVSIAADAHATQELDYLEHALPVARRAGLRPEDVLNTRSLDELRRWLVDRRGRTQATAPTG